MARTAPDFTLGIEEEYLLVDRDSLALTAAPEGLMEECAAELEGQVSPEFMQCQIEIGTRVCADIAAARDDLRRLRAAVARHAARHNLAPIAASCHPFSEWRSQHHTDKDRYNELRQSLGGVARRMLICGMHVHVGIDNDNLRADLMPQFSYFLPHLLALSTSSPFWVGDDTGLSSFRLTIFDNLPRTGLPPHFQSWGEYERATNVLVELGEIEDTTKIWWDLRPSHRFPTLEMRICDVSPRMEHALTLAATTQALMRFLWRMRERNQRWRIYERFLINENRWRAMRYGIEGGLIDFGRRQIVPFGELVEELVDLIAEDAEALGCLAEVEGLRDILSGGTSAMRQRAVVEAATTKGKSQDDALRDVVRTLIEEYGQDL